MTEYNELVGLVPAGGHATRISPLPCSKELLPIGWRADQHGNLKPKVVSQHLLEHYQRAGVSKTYFILRKGKWDIAQYYGDGEQVGMDLAYLIMSHPYGHPFTLDKAYPFTRGNLVAFGYPDILFEPADAFQQLIEKQAKTRAAVMLGIFPIRPDQRWDICTFNHDGSLDVIALPEPPAGDKRYGWSIAVWTPEFTQFMHEYLGDRLSKNQVMADDGKEFVMNHLFQAAMDAGLTVDYVLFDQGSVRDVGTPPELIAAQLHEAMGASALLKGQ